MKKSRLAVLAGITISGLLLAGCSDPGSGSSSTDSAAWPSATANLKGTTLTLWGAASVNSELGEPIKAFEKATGATIKVVPFAGVYENSVETKVATGDKPDLATWQPTESQLTVINAKQNLLPIDNAPWLSGMKPAVKDLGGLLGSTRYAALFTQPSIIGVFYNKQVFAKAGITTNPTNWADMIADAKKIKATGTAPLYDIAGDQWGTQWIVQAQLAEAARAGLWTRVNHNKETFSDPTILDAITSYDDLVKQGYFNSNLKTATYDQQTSALLNGTTGMTFQVSGTVSALLQKSTVSKLNSTVGFFPLSKDGSIATSLPDQSNGLIAFNTGDTKKEQAAKQFMRFLMTDGYANFIKSYATTSIMTGVPDPSGLPDMTADVTKALSDSVGGMQALAVANPDLYINLANMDQGAVTPAQVAATTQKQFAQLAKASGASGF